MRTTVSSGLAGTSLAFLLAGLGLRSWELVIIALVPLVFLALGALAPPSRPRLLALRTMSRDRLEVGREIEVTLEVRNEGAPLDLLEILDAIPPELSLARGSNHAVVPLDAGESFTLSYTVTPTLKGDYRLGPVRARSLDPLALAAEDTIVDVLSRVVVAPMLEDLRRTKLAPRRTRPWYGQVPSRQIGIGTEFWGVRGYVPGDEVRRINWKACARLDRLFSNEYEGERSGDVILFLDARRECFIGSDSQNPVEYGVRAALAIAEHILATKNRVGLIVQRDVLDWVDPAYGRKQLYRILDSLVHVRSGGQWSFHRASWVVSRLFPDHALVILISPLVDRTSLEAVTDIAAHGYDVAVVSPSPIAIERALLGDASEVDVAYRILSMERANLISQLRRVAPVVDWDPSTPLALSLRRLAAWPLPG